MELCTIFCGNVGVQLFSHWVHQSVLHIIFFFQETFADTINNWFQSVLNADLFFVSHHVYPLTIDNSCAIITPSIYLIYFCCWYCFHVVHRVDRKTWKIVRKRLTLPLSPLDRYRKIDKREIEIDQGQRKWNREMNWKCDNDFLSQSSSAFVWFIIRPIWHWHWYALNVSRESSIFLRCFISILNWKLNGMYWTNEFIVADTHKNISVLNRPTKVPKMSQYRTRY